jgi:hypothetical protein
MADADDGRYDPEQLERGYRYYKALEHQRRGWMVIRELVRDFLAGRRWELRQPEQLERASLELVDVLLVAGALTLYQAGVNDDNWREAQERKKKREAATRADELRAAANEARDDERHRVDVRLAELNSEREAERYLVDLKAQLEREELNAAEERGELAPIHRRGRT